MLKENPKLAEIDKAGLFDLTSIRAVLAERVSFMTEDSLLFAGSKNYKAFDPKKIKESKAKKEIEATISAYSTT